MRKIDAVPQEEQPPTVRLRRAAAEPVAVALSAYDSVALVAEISSRLKVRGG